MFSLAPSRLLAGGVLSFALTFSQAWAQEASTADAAPAADSASNAPAETAAAQPAEAPPSDAAAVTPAAADTSAAPAAADAAPAAAPEAVATIPVKTKAEEEPLKDTESKGTRLDAVQVTGSRIKRTDYETAQPVTMISREQIDKSGLTNIGELLARISAAGASVNPTFSTIALAGGEFNLDLRNLGSNRLLVLVNGHRWVNGLNSSGTSSVDLNNIPTSVIERVEVLKDGASAIYGSDAIAGVVNIITRKDYDGQEFFTQIGEYQQHDGARQQHSLAFGRLMSSTSIFGSLTYSQEDAVKTTTRAVSAYPQVGAGSTRLSGFGPNSIAQFIPNPANGTLFGCPNLAGGVAAGVISTTTDTNATINGAGAPVPLNGLPNFVLPGYQLTPQQITALNSVPVGLQLCKLVHTPGGVDSDPTTPLGYHAYNANTDGFNRYQDSNLQNPSKRGSLFLQLKQELLDNVNFNFEGLYNVRNSQSQLRPQALLAGDLAGTAAYLASDQKYNDFNQDIGKGSPQALVDNLGLGVGSGVVGIRLTKTFPGVITKDRYNTLHLGAGFDGNFSVLTQNFTWDAGYGYSTNKRKEQRTGDYRADRLILALGPAANCTGSCVPLDVLHGIDAVTQDMVDYLAVIAHNATRERQDDAYANVSTDLGPIHLPAGPIALAFGVEYRHDTYEDEPDMILQKGLSSGNNSVRTQGSAIAKELYTEFGIPLLADFPGFKLLELSLAGRHSIYRDFGGVNTGKVGIRWKPFGDELLLRGTYSSAFRAPSVGELFLGDSDSFESVDDPCASSNDPTTVQNCKNDGADGAAQPTGGQLRSTVGGNKKLKPERAHTATFGFVFEPSLVPNLAITADYYSIRIKDIVAQPGAQFILDSCYRNAQRSLCQFVHRNAGNLSGIEDRLVNYAAEETSGIDFGGNYKLPVEPSFGEYKLSLDASYLRNFDQFIPDAVGGVQQFGFVGTSQGFVGIPRWKANGGLDWKMNHLSVSWTTRMIYQKNEACVDAIAPPNGPTLQQLGLCSHPNVTAAPNGNLPTPVEVPGLVGAPIDKSENKLHTIFYHDVQVGYDVTQYNLNLAIGVNNLFNQDPPISRDPGTGGAYFNYDVLSYEIPGRFPYVRLGVKF